MFINLFITILLSCSSIQIPDHPLTLAEMIDIALEMHPETKQAWWNAKRATAVVGEAKSSFYPELSLNANGNQGRDFKFINGPYTSYTTAGANLALSLILFDFGERKAEVQATREALIAANWQTDLAMQKVIIRVLESSYRAQGAQESLQASLSSLEDAKKMLKYAEKLHLAGLSAPSDVYTSRSTLAQMKIEVEDKRATLDIQIATLATHLGLSADIALQIAPLEMAPLQPQGDVSALIALASTQRRELLVKRARILESCFHLKKIKSAYSPKLSLSALSGYEHALHDNTKGANYDIGLNLQIPLFNGFLNTYRYRAAYAEVQINQEELAELELTIALEVLTYSRNLVAAQEMLLSADENLENAQKAYDGVLDKYRIGEENIVAVSNAQQQLALARILHSQVKMRLQLALANLAYATGGLAYYSENPCTQY